MRKTILAVLMLLVFMTPCLPDETVPEWMNALNGTLWQSTCHTKIYTCNFGFCDGDIYGMESWDYCWIKGVQYYGDWPIVIYNTKQSRPGFRSIDIFQPMLGFGISFWIDDSPPYLSIALLHKVSDDWEPAGCEDPGNF